MSDLGSCSSYEGAQRALLRRAVVLRKYLVKYLFIYLMSAQPHISEQNIFLCYFTVTQHAAAKHSNCHEGMSEDCMSEKKLNV